MMRRRMIVAPVGICSTLGIAMAAQAGVNFFLAPGPFGTAMANAGKFEKAFWDFNPHNLPPASIVGVTDFLDINTHPLAAPGVWDGAPGMWNPDLDNVQFIANLTPGNGPLTPHLGGFGLAFASTGFNGLGNNFLLANYFVDSFDIISGPPAGDNHTGMGLEILNNPTFGNPFFLITVFDKNDNEIGSIDIQGLDGKKIFLGIETFGGDTIGRVDIFDLNQAGSEGISSISVWTPAPGGLALIAIAGAIGTRRRRR